MNYKKTMQQMVNLNKDSIRNSLQSNTTHMALDTLKDILKKYAPPEIARFLGNPISDLLLVNLLTLSLNMAGNQDSYKTVSGGSLQQAMLSSAYTRIWAYFGIDKIITEFISNLQAANQPK